MRFGHIVYNEIHRITSNIEPVKWTHKEDCFLLNYFTHPIITTTISLTAYCLKAYVPLVVIRFLFCIHSSHSNTSTHNVQHAYKLLGQILISYTATTTMATY